jgi:hypothetical protein
MILAVVVMLVAAVFFRAVLGWHVFLFLFPVPFIASWWINRPPRRGEEGRK